MAELKLIENLFMCPFCLVTDNRLKLCKDKIAKYSYKCKECATRGFIDSINITKNMWYLETILIKGLKGNVSALPNLISTEKEFDKKIRLKQPNTVLFKNKVICPFCFRKEYLTMQTCKMNKSETHETYYVRHHKLRAKSGKKLHLSCEACNTQLFVKPSRAIPALIFLEKILLIKHLDLNIARSVIRYTKTEELQTFLEKEDKGVTL